MKIEEAIKILVCNLIAEYACPDSSEEYKEALNVAISALEKQIPREPILLKSMVVKRCPVCKCVAESDCEEYGYCQYCGQALKWR